MRTTIARAVWLIVTSAAAAEAGDWPQFLGPERNGRSRDSVRRQFGSAGPKILWRKPVGRGFAGPVVSDASVILFHRQNDQAVVEAMAAADGATRWKYTRPTDYRDDFGFDDGPRSPSTVAGGRVMSWGADGTLTALEASSGRRLWERDLAAEFGAPKGWFGRCGAPLVVGDRVIVQTGGRRDGKPAGISAFAVDSGEVSWTASEAEPSYSSPVVASVHDQPCAIFFTRSGVEGLDPATGNNRFRAAFAPDIDASVSACTPVICGPARFLLSGCYGLGARVWEIAPDWRLRDVWHHRERLDAHYATPVFVDGHLYGFHGRQEQGQEFRCLDAATGALRWGVPLPAGSVIAAASTLVIVTEKGELLLVDADPRSFNVLARGQILGATARAVPALAHSVLYARDSKNLVAVDLSPQ